MTLTLPEPPTDNPRVRLATELRERYPNEVRALLELARERGEAVLRARAQNTP